MSLLFNMLSSFVITFLPRSKHLLSSPFAMNLEPKKNKICHCFYFSPTYLPWSDGKNLNLSQILNLGLSFFIYIMQIMEFFQELWKVLDFYCYAPSPYLRSNHESEQVHHSNAKARGKFISSALGLKPHPTQRNKLRAPNKGVWRLIYRQFFVSVTGVAGVTWLARQDECMTCLFLVGVYGKSS